MLRESGNRTGNTFDLSAIVDEQPNAGGVPSGDTLVDFVNTILQGNADDAPAARKAVRTALGDAAFVDVCATVASFNSVVKIADGCGIPLEPLKETRTTDIRQALGIDKFRP